MNQRHIKAIMIAAVTLLALTVITEAQNFRKALGIARDAVNKANSGGDLEKPKRQRRKTSPRRDKQLTAAEIVNKANFVWYYQGDDSRANVSMEIVDATGGKKKLEMTILRSDGPDSTGEVTGDQKYFVYISQPEELAKTALLVAKHADKPDDRWLYSPSMEKVEKIPPEKGRTSFVGSNIFYEDLTGRDAGDDVHELLADETDETYFVLKSTPKDRKSVEFAHYKTRIRRGTFVVVWRTYYDRTPKAIRMYEADKFKKIQGFTTITHSRITDLRTKTYTDLLYDKVTYNIGLNENIFQERSLRQPPLKHLQGK